MSRSFILTGRIGILLVPSVKRCVETLQLVHGCKATVEFSSGFLSKIFRFEGDEKAFRVFKKMIEELS